MKRVAITAMVCLGGRPPPHLTHHRAMTNTELTLDQLQVISGGATAIEYGLMAAVAPRENTGEAGMECKVPPSVKKPLSSLIAVVIIAA